MKKPVIIAFFILATTLSCTTKYRSMHSFETVWQTVDQAHYDPTFGGVDWKAGPRAIQTSNRCRRQPGRILAADKPHVVRA